MIICEWLKKAVSPRKLINIVFPNELDKIARKYGTDKMSTKHGYTEYYFKYFKEFKNSAKSVLEIGVREGWSHKMWYEFFPEAVIYGIDHYRGQFSKPKEEIENERIKIFIGDQADENFLKNTFSSVKFDIIIDDGGHWMSQQQISLKALYPLLKSGGIYVIEDLHTSKDRNFWDTNDEKATTMHALRSFLDKGEIDSYYFSADDAKYFNENTKSLKIIENNICFIEKR